MICLFFKALHNHFASRLPFVGAAKQKRLVFGVLLWNSKRVHKAILLYIYIFFFLCVLEISSSEIPGETQTLADVETIARSRP